MVHYNHFGRKYAVNIAEFNSSVKEDAKFEAELVFAISVNHSCELHHLPKASRADRGKHRILFLIDLLLIVSLLIFLVHYLRQEVM